ncbi:BgTH12-04379, partial [Blumeria graminis f. sp. triticale]
DLTLPLVAINVLPRPRLPSITETACPIVLEPAASSGLIAPHRHQHLPPHVAVAATISPLVAACRPRQTAAGAPAPTNSRRCHGSIAPNRHHLARNSLQPEFNSSRRPPITGGHSRSLAADPWHQHCQSRQRLLPPRPSRCCQRAMFSKQ